VHDRSKIAPLYPKANLKASRYEYALDVAQRTNLPATSRVVFDIGAGEGSMKQPLEAAAYRWVGFDLNPRGQTIHPWDLTFPCPTHGVTPSLILCLDVIEHLLNPGLALSNIARILQPNGQVIITTPNPRWSRSRMWALMYGDPVCFTQKDLELNGHVFPVWPHILEKVLHNTGFEIVEYVTLDGRTVWPGPPFSLRYPLRCLVALVLMAIEYFDPSSCGMTYGVVAKLKAGR
jgi:SAM-dependent methyltransferase